MFDDLGIRYKLGLIALLAILPATILLYLLVSEKNIAIEFARAEIRGTVLLAPVQELRLAASREYLASIGGSAVPATKGAATRVLRTLREAPSRESLLPEARLDPLDAAWRAFEGLPPGVSADARRQRWRDFHRELHRTNAVIGDLSNLILDPDLDSYYMMDAVLLKLPELHGLLVETAGLVAEASVRGSISSDERAALISLMGQIESEAEALEENMHRGFSSSASQALRGSLEEPLRRFRDRMILFKGAVRSAILEAEKPNPADARLSTALGDAVEAGRTLWQGTAAELTTLLERRIASFQSRKLQALLVVAVTVALCLFVLVTIANRLGSRLARLSRFTSSIISETPFREDQSAAAQSGGGSQMLSRDEIGELARDQLRSIVSSDEVGNLATVFISMSDQLGRHVGELRESSRKLAQSNQFLELRVTERTQELSEKNRDLENALLDLQRTQAQLVKQENMASLGQLTAGIAHEIKNPLNFVNNLSGLVADLVADLRELLKEGISPADKEEIATILDDLQSCAQKIHEHGRRADAIVRGMQFHSRESSGSLEPVDLNLLVQDVVSLAWNANRLAMPMDLDLQYDLDPGVGTVEVIPQQFSTAVINVARNAFWALHSARDLKPHGWRPQLRITTRESGDFAEVIFRDNGIGMPPEVREKIFNPFFTTKPPGEGVGMGLSFTWDIVVTIHHGEVLVDSQPLEYAEFRLRVPLVARLSREGVATAAGVS